MRADQVGDLPILAHGATWTLYREPALMLVRFHGDVDDEASATWRNIARKNFDEAGFPRFAFVSPTEGTASTTLGSRMRTAAFLRFTAQNVERVTIVSNRETTFIVRTMLRAAGASNVVLVAVADAPAELARQRAAV